MEDMLASSGSSRHRDRPRLASCGNLGLLQSRLNGLGECARNVLAKEPSRVTLTLKLARQVTRPEAGDGAPWVGSRLRSPAQAPIREPGSQRRGGVVSPLGSRMMFC